MMDINVSKCKRCIVALAFTKTRIGEDDVKRACKLLCGRSKRNSLDEPDLFMDLNKQDSRFVHGWFISQHST